MSLFRLDQSNEVASVDIRGEIVENRKEIYDGEDHRLFCLQQFEEEANLLPNTVNHFEVFIDSPGGSQSSGMALYRFFKDHPASVTVTIGSNAKSAATLPMCAADTVRVSPTSVVMIHKSWRPFIENMNADELEANMQDLTASDRQMAEVYSQKTGKSIDELMEAMSKTTYLQGVEAVEYGLADELIDGDIKSLSVEEVKAMDKETKEKSLKDTVRAWAEENIKAEDMPEKKPEEKPEQPEQPAPAQPAEKPEEKPEEKEDPEASCKKDPKAELERISELFSFAEQANLSFDVLNSAFKSGANADQLAREIVIASASQAQAKAAERSVKNEQIKQAFIQDAEETVSIPTSPVTDNKAKDDGEDDWKLIIETARKGIM